MSIDCDPAIFQQTLAVLVQLLVLSLLLERGLHFVFHFNLWRDFLGEKKSLKALVSLGTSLLICFCYELNAIAEVIDPDKIHVKVGTVITALVISGGSIGVLRMMQAFRGTFNEKIQSGRQQDRQ